MPAWLLPITPEFRKSVKEGEPKSLGKGGGRLLLHYAAVKLAEVLARPDVYGDVVVVPELASQWKWSVTKFAKFREGYVRIAELQGMKPALASANSATKQLSPARVRTLLKRLNSVLEKSFGFPPRARRRERR